ncbi:Cas10/Cmr2 second palm domain-containing protein [Gordonia sp. NPDC062954]|uniref:Cas10/Cmr2 second palm domain-containing protein n=1 Tax=Gordonia sp. NPDC062954 TaxID=3364003 RepID=UPI0037C81213
MSSKKEREPRVERRLRSAIADRLGMTRRSVTLPRDFQGLARGEHLALIYCDGNKVGDFITTAVGHGVGPDTIAPAINNGTIDAVAEALVEMHREIPAMPIRAVPHILGGDDVQITVPASAAWAFTRHLLKSFSSRVPAEVGKDLAKGRGLPDISMSAGVVFFHRSTPMRDVLDLAEGQLRHAKQHVRGREASVAYLDIPADGQEAPPTRRPYRIDDLDKWSELLDEVASIPPAQRATLLDLVRSNRHTEARARARWAGHTCIDELESMEPAALDIRDQLEIARWWSQ